MSQKIVKKRKVTWDDVKRDIFGKKMRFTKALVPRVPRAVLSPDIKYKDSAVRFTYLNGGGSGGSSGIDGASAGLAALINTFSLGTNDGQRIGRKITIRNISFWYNFHVSSGETGVHNRVQWGFLLEKSTQATFMVFDDAFDMTTSNKVENTLKPDSLGKYKILWRDFIELPASSEIGTFMQPKMMGSGYLNYKGKKKGGIVETFYKTDNGDYRDVEDNGIYLYYLTDLANTKYALDCHYRIAYSDV